MPGMTAAALRKTSDLPAAASFTSNNSVKHLCPPPNFYACKNLCCYMKYCTAGAEQKCLSRDIYYQKIVYIYI